MYLLEGNIGAGKSTLLKLIKKHLPHIAIAQEPVNSWHKEEQQASLLDHFYQDQQRWGFSMEHNTLVTRVQHYLEEQHKNISPLIMERSIYSGYYCFALNGYKKGTLSDVEWQVYNAWFTFLVQNKCTPPQGFIYLHTTPEICYKRIQKRARSGEEIIPLSYLQEIHNAHENFLTKKQGLFKELKDVPVLYIDVSQEFTTDQKQIDFIINNIITFIDTKPQNTNNTAASLLL